MATVIATVALALAPMLDEALTCADLDAKPHHHHRHHARRIDPPTQAATASYYTIPPGATTACGFISPMGVANRSLPCGTRVRMCAARCVVAVVDDRGPYVLGRLWDLSVGLAQAIGFDFYAGVAPVRWVLA